MPFSSDSPDKTYSQKMFQDARKSLRFSVRKLFHAIGKVLKSP